MDYAVKICTIWSVLNVTSFNEHESVLIGNLTKRKVNIRSIICYKIEKTGEHLNWHLTIGATGIILFYKYLKPCK